MKDSVDLAGIGEVPPDWMHRQKEASPAEAQPLPGAYLKWYDVYPSDEPVADLERSRARAFLEDETERGALAFRNELGFVVLHRSGTFHFLIICIWREVNELWQVLYAKDTGGTYQQVADVERFRPVQCVWELGPTAHERQAWSSYLSSARDEASKWAYIEDVYKGAV